MATNVLVDSKNIILNVIEGSLKGSLPISGPAQIGWLYDPASATASEAPPATLDKAKARQIQLIKQSCESAQIAPLAFTPAGGAAAQFLMDPDSQHKFMAATMIFGSKGQAPIPASMPFYDQNGQPVQMTASDITNFSIAAITQVQNALAKQATLLAQIAAAPDVVTVLAIKW